MDDNLADMLIEIGDELKDQISAGSRYYLEVDIGKRAEKFGCSEFKKKYHGVYAIVPLKHPVNGMKVRVDGRTFVNYAQFESGIVLPSYLAKKVNLSYKTYIPNDSMIRIFA